MRDVTDSFANENKTTLDLRAADSFFEDSDHILIAEPPIKFLSAQQCIFVRGTDAAFETQFP